MAVAVELLRAPAARRCGGVAGLAALPLHAALKHACRNAALALRSRLPQPMQGSRCECLMCMMQAYSKVSGRLLASTCCSVSIGSAVGFLCQAQPAVLLL